MVEILHRCGYTRIDSNTVNTGRTEVDVEKKFSMWRILEMFVAVFAALVAWSYLSLVSIS